MKRTCVLLVVVSTLFPFNANTEGNFQRQPALGRLVQLGAVYYAADERLAFDETLWKIATIRTNSTKENITSSTSKIKVLRSKLEKFEYFDVNAEITLSVLAGLIEISGGAGYLRDEKGSSEKSTIAFTYK